ncbi:MAG: PcfJ domain-containing protein [Methanobrevibacter sp.]|nr:PcfJ domain-containing protein [Methanobrevibacter sp.]
MKVPTDWEDKIVIEDGKIWRVVMAYWGSEYCLDVYRESEDNEYEERNLYQACMHGFVVAFPGMPLYAHGPKDEIAYLENWCRRAKPRDFGGGELTATEKEWICELHPNFKYVFKKYKIRYKWELIEILAMWKKHPELEMVLATGYSTIGMTEGFWKLSEEKRKQICRFMRLYPRFKDMKLREVQSCIKSKNPELYAEYIQTVDSWDRTGAIDYGRITFEDFLYLRKVKGIKKDCFESEMARKVSIFKDVLRALMFTHHDPHDEYWRHPKDLIEIHNRLMEERRRMQEAQQMEQIKECARKLKNIQKKFSGITQTIDGYSIFISTDYDEWKRQADELHQCIVASGYYQGMANGNYTIVFIQKDGVPQATAQIYPGGKLGQFYANELDRNNCLPSAEIREAFNKWLDLVPKSKFKKYKRKAA